LPAQYGFDVSEELVFTFDSLVSQRNFLFKIESSFDALNDSSIDLSHIKFTTLKKDKTMPEEYVLAQSKLDLTSQTNEFKLNSVFSSLRINRKNERSYIINYQLETNDGDCDFDQSLCNYSSKLMNADNELSSFFSNAAIQHLPKYPSINTYYEEEIVEKEFKDFYLSVSTLDRVSNKNAAIYSPLIKIKTNEKHPSSSFNNRMLKLSFNYMMLENSNAEIDLQMVSSRSDVAGSLRNYLNVSYQSIGKFLSEGKEKISPIVNPRMFSNLNECPSKSFSQFVKGLDKASYKPVWHVVQGISFFSCFDFHLKFDMKFGNEASDSIVGIDDVQLDYEDGNHSSFIYYKFMILKLIKETLKK